MRIMFLVFWGWIGAVAAQAQPVDAKRKELDGWMMARAELMLQSKAIETEIRQAWESPDVTSPEVETLREKIKVLQEELVRVKSELQKKVQELPAVRSKHRALAANQAAIQELTRKISERKDAK